MLKSVGESLVSAPTQLEPVTNDGTKNHIAEFRASSALFLGERINHKENDGYTGIHVDEIEANIAWVLSGIFLSIERPCQVRISSALME